MIEYEREAIDLQQYIKTIKISLEKYIEKNKLLLEKLS
jgi:hypothetical protein